MELSKDALEFIRLLNQKKVEYLIVGGWAVAIHGKPRYTKDIDIFISRSPQNAEAILVLLKEFGFESLDLNRDDFMTPHRIVQLGVEPNRIDLLTSISAVDFDEAYKNKVLVECDGEMLNFINVDDLIKNKKATGRDQDLIDIKVIESKANKRKS